MERLAIQSPIADLFNLILGQREFLEEVCHELDCNTEALAIAHNDPDANFGKRGSTRQDVNRERLLEELERVSDGGLRNIEVDPETYLPGNKYSSRVETAFRVFRLPDAVQLKYRLAIVFCNQSPALFDAEIETLRLAVDSHIQWLPAYREFCDGGPMTCDFDHDCLTKLRRLRDLAESVGALREAETVQTEEPERRKPKKPGRKPTADEIANDKLVAERWESDAYPKGGRKNRVATAAAWLETHSDMGFLTERLDDPDDHEAVAKQIKNALDRHRRR